MIILDTETTGFTRPEVIQVEHQPEIIEFAAVRVNEHLIIEQEISFLCRPRNLPLTAEVIRATGIMTEMLLHAAPFSRHVHELTQFFLGEETMVAHNCSFDRDVLAYELKRVERLTRFPWPWNHIDTVELTMDIPAERKKSPRLKLSELYFALTGLTPVVKHRALDDVKTLLECVRALRARDGRI